MHRNAAYVSLAISPVVSFHSCNLRHHSGYLMGPGGKDGLTLRWGGHSCAPYLSFLILFYSGQKVSATGALKAK